MGGHSAGAHLILCMIDKLLARLSEPLKIDSIYLISGLYDLSEVQYTNSNENNVLSINSSNVDQLSPLRFDFTKWEKQHTKINIYVAQYDSPTFIRQSMELYLRFSNGFKVDFQLVQDHDHFDIVEELCVKSYQITKSIIASSSSADYLKTVATSVLIFTVTITINAISLI